MCHKCRFGVRPLPKRQMILKLREIHQYTHQLASSDSEDEAPCAGGSARLKPPPSRLTSCAQTGNFKEPKAPEARPTEGHDEEKDTEPLSASQGSNTSSTAASEESERCAACYLKTKQNCVHSQKRTLTVFFFFKAGPKVVYKYGSLINLESS